MGLAPKPAGRALLLLAFLLLITSLSAQQNQLPVQQLRGVLKDIVVQTPLAGATVTLTQLDRHAVTNSEGEFRFTNVPVGTYQLVVNALGYKPLVLDNVNLISGKETVLALSLEIHVLATETITVRGSSRKNKPLNEMSLVSARAFTVEETQRYAAAVNDPLRMATAFPGVFAADDGNNSIVIRGNSPTGLLWRMEGVDIPNPNHFSATGSSGGGISILSTQLLSNSDFITGAFAAEYGNALSGVFDLKLRKGNNEKREYALQAGVLGLNAAAEGPFQKGGKSSYLVNYRYSTLSVLDKLGVPMEGGATNFQDLSFNLHLPTKEWGSFGIFGFGGLSDQQEKPLKDSAKWTGRSDRYSGSFLSNTGALGLTHQLGLGSRTRLSSAIGISYNKIAEHYDFLLPDYTLREDYRDQYGTRKLTVNSVLHHRFSASSTFRAGVILTDIQFDYFKREKEDDTASLKEVIRTRGNTQTFQGYAQWQWKPVDRLTINGGLHFLELMYNKTRSLEPRAAVRWQLGKRDVLGLGFGQHSQIQPLGVYFARQEMASGSIGYPNRDLGLTKARHYVLSYQHGFSKTLALKAEAYYQELLKVPVSIYDSSSFSVLNITNEYVTDPLVNRGRGRNYGLELSLEQYLSNRLYYTLSSSLYQSKYQALDGVERNTRFNGNYLFTLVAGKEFLSSNKLRTFGINLRTIYAGGQRTTPIDLARSIAEGKPVYEEQGAFTLQNPDYFRSDLRLSMKWNRKRVTSTLSIDVQNVSNRLNVYGQYFDIDKKAVKTIYQTGLIPVLNYKIEW